MKQSFLILAVMAFCLLGSAGTLYWWQGWLFLFAMAIVSLLTSDVLKGSPSLARERKTAYHKAKGWDKNLVPLVSGFLPVLSIVLAGLDKRFGWTGPMGEEVPFLAFAVMMGGSALTYWAMKTNPFFSSVVRIQKERGHRVVSGGPYAFLRHPGYAGSILYNLGGPLLLGSLASLGAGGATALLLVARTAFEDKTLHEELKGYSQYAKRVRSKLVPFIW